MNLKYCVGCVRWNDRMCIFINWYVYVNNNYYFYKKFDVIGDKFDK